MSVAPDLDKYFPLFEREMKLHASDLGLYGGVSGFAIVCFLVGKYSTNPCFIQKGYELLDLLSKHIAEVSKLDFASGLAGIGWAIEWLKQNGLLEVNTDEVLEEVDDTLYRSVVYASNSDIGLEQGTLGKLNYFLKRYESGNAGTHRFRTICHQECLVILTDDLKTKICEENQFLLKVFSKNEWIITAQVFLFLGDFWVQRLNLETVETVIYFLAEHVNEFLKKQCLSERIITFSAEEILALQYLVYSFYWIGRQFHCYHWCKQSLTCFGKLFENTKHRISLSDYKIYAMLKNMLKSDEWVNLNTQVKYNGYDITSMMEQDLGNEGRIADKLLTILALEIPKSFRCHELLRPYNM